MAIDFKKLAQEATSLSPIMVGREKLDTEDVVNKEFTIIEFGFAPKFDKNSKPVVDPETGEVDTYGVVVLQEIPDHYYCVGKVFTNVCKIWAAQYDTVEEASSDLAASGGVRVRFYPDHTKNGNNLTKVQILS